MNQDCKAGDVHTNTDGLEYRAEPMTDICEGCAFQTTEHTAINDRRCQNAPDCVSNSLIFVRHIT